MGQLPASGPRENDTAIDSSIATTDLASHQWEVMEDSSVDHFPIIINTRTQPQNATTFNRPISQRLDGRMSDLSNQFYLTINKRH